MIKLQLAWGNETRALELDDGEHSVGRAGDNTINVPIGRVSKRHAAIRIDGDRLFVRDLGSTNGTLVDDVRIGGGEVEVPTSSKVQFAGATLRRDGVSMTTSPKLMADAAVSMIAKYNVSEGLSNQARERILDLSSELFELLASEKESAEIVDAACRFVGKFIDADRVVLLEDQGEGTTVEIRVQWTRKKQDDGAMLQLSSTIVNQVLAQRDSVLVSDPSLDPRYGGQQSIMALNLRSAMAAPLFDNTRVRGILYVDTANPMTQYVADDLQVLTATANAVAVKLRSLSLEREIQTAAKIQRSMLPAEIKAPDGYEIDAYQLMCREVGGDLYHGLERPNGKMLLALGDVSGKGVPAALAMTAATVLIGSLAKIGGDVKEMAQHFHTELINSLAEDQFLTLFLAELDPATGRLEYVNAGHEPALVYHSDGTMDQLESTGLPVAMIDPTIIEVAEYQLRPGDLVTIVSDGIPEATVDGTNFLDMEPIKKILSARHNGELSEIRDELINAVNEFLSGQPPSDDVTLMLLRREA